jgi:hypothetical protein
MDGCAIGGRPIVGFGSAMDGCGRGRIVIHRLLSIVVVLVVVSIVLVRGWFEFA